MENFKLLEQIGQGAQATNFLAESKTGPPGKCVLKKVECFDESEANKAFRESQDLLTLDHPYVSGYKEFFVMWEKENSSMYMTIVMEYFPHGHLGKLIKEHRESKVPIPEEKIKNWIGQVIEGLVYVNQKGIVHRDVKPNNIYLQEDGTVKLGDFAVDTVMGDTTTCTRATLDMTNYMAPEVCEKGFSPQSDIWSLGCILFELTTSSLLNCQEAKDKLKAIKEDTFAMEDILEDVAKLYSGELVTLIRTMMKTRARPSALDQKKNNSYVKACVEMTDASQLEKRKRQQSAKRAQGRVPREEGVLAILKYLASNVDFEDLVLEALDCILEMCKESDTFTIDPNGKKLICMAMRNSLQNEAIQLKGCEILNRLLVTDNADETMYSREVISVIPRAMEQHANSAEVQQVGASGLMALCSNDDAIEGVGYLGGIQHLLNAMKKFPNSPELCYTCCHALWSLAVNENNVKIVTEQKGLHTICEALKQHMNSAEVAESASAALLAITNNDENFEYVGDLNCVGLLISAIETHATNPKVVKNAALALASLVEPDEECAYRVLITNEDHTDELVSGVPKIMKAYELHKDNAEVVESIATLLMELAEYDEISYDLNSFGVKPSLVEIKQKFARNKDIMGPCEKALNKLQSVIKQKAIKT